MRAAAGDAMTSSLSGVSPTRSATRRFVFARMLAETTPAGRWVARMRWMPRLRPRWAILHVQEADAAGNARIFGSPGYDVLMAQAADEVILTVERIVPTEELARLPELTNERDMRNAGNAGQHALHRVRPGL